MPLICQLKPLTAVVGLLTCSLAFAVELNTKNVKPSGLTVAQAEQVLRVVLKHEGYKMSDPHLWIDGPRPGSPPFIPGYHSYGLAYVNNTQGHYSVNIFTGDVWQTESCTRYIFPALSRIQRRISERSGKTLLSDEEARSEVGCPADSP
ncbi:hypothetical protein [Massilia aquatica]|uniref:Secreted protein n=1 Tax=Massilia aquatica TaxID=2609000 RepID=A0ABX0LXX7_9BURK|nr:hypothetical protein [Massilia aquatica]NHZ39308.1 hypothetical protein [Massilia aquatica]